MKRIVLLTALSIFFQFSKAQAPSWIWAESSNGGDWENGVGLSIDTANHLYLDGRINGTVSFGGGSVTSGCSYSNNPFCGEMDTAGHAIWFQSYDYSCGNDYTEGFGRDNYDNTYATGIIGSNCCGMFVEKYDKSGNLKWPLPLGSNNGSAGLGVTADNAGYVYVCGTMSNGTMTYGPVTMTYTGSSQSIILFKLDSTGNFIWGKAINGDGTIDGDDQARDIIVDNKGYIYIIGDYSGQPIFGTDTVPASTAGNKNFFLAKYDTAGNEIWVNTVNNSWANDDFGGTSGLVMDSCGNLYVTGLFVSTANFGNLPVASAGGQDMFVARSDNNGNWQWAQSAGGTGNDNGQAITIDKNSDIYVAGYSNSGGLNFGNSVSTTSGDIFVVKYSNGNGAAQWAQSATANSGVGAITVDKQKYVYAFGSIGGSSATFGSTTLSLSSTQNLVLAKLDTVTSRTIIPKIAQNYCPGSTDTIQYTITGTFNSGNTFTVQLSDSTGSFVNYTNLGSITSTGDSEIVINIPNSIPSGSTYLIRVVSSNPAASSYFNGCGSYYVNNVYINNFYVTIGGSLNVSVTPTDTNICLGASVKLAATGGTSYLWSNNDTTGTITVTPTADTTTYSVTVINGGCVGTDSIMVTLAPVAPLIIEPTSTSICPGTSIVLTVPTSGSDYTWSPSATLSTTTGDTVTAKPTIQTIYTATGTDSVGCTVAGADTISISQAPNKPSITQYGDTLISSATQGNQWQRNDTVINGATNQTYIAITKGYYQVTASNPANGCSTTSNSASATGVNQLTVESGQVTVYPNPTGGIINVNISSSAMEVKDWNLQVTDVLGRTVYFKQSLNYNNTVDLSNLSSGVYFICVINKTSRAVVPLVKQ